MAELKIDVTMTVSYTGTETAEHAKSEVIKQLNQFFIGRGLKVECEESGVNLPNKDKKPLEEPVSHNRSCLGCKYTGSNFGIVCDECINFSHYTEYTEKEYKKVNESIKRKYVNPPESDEALVFNLLADGVRLTYGYGDYPIGHTVVGKSYSMAFHKERVMKIHRSVYFKVKDKGQWR